MASDLDGDPGVFAPEPDLPRQSVGKGCQRSIRQWALWLSRAITTFKGGFEATHPLHHSGVVTHRFGGSGFGFRVSNSEIGFRFSSFELQVSGFGFRVRLGSFKETWAVIRASGFGFRVSVFSFRFSGFGLRVWGFRFRFSGSELRVSGLELRLCSLKETWAVIRVLGFGFRISEF